MKRYAFYPGCTLHSTGVEFGVSSELVCERLGLEMVEIPDWNCCGASSAHSMKAELTLALPARNLVKAQETGLEDLAIPCAACYSRLAAAGKALGEDGGFRGRMEEMLGVRWAGRVRPPGERGGWDDPEQPQSMDYVLGLGGAEVVPWSYGVDCCGGSLTLNRSDVVVHLVDRLARAAREAGAEALATACPMCMANVDGRQLYRGGRPLPRPAKAGYEPVPIFYFTELMALAYGLPVGKVLGRHMVDPRPLLKRVGVIER